MIRPDSDTTLTNKWPKLDPNPVALPHSERRPTLSLTREVRICLSPKLEIQRTDNSWSSWESNGHQLATFLQIRLTVNGAVDLQTGFLCDVRLIDEAIWATAEATFKLDNRGCSVIDLIMTFAERIEKNLPHEIHAISLEIAVSPFLSYQVQIESRTVVTITHQYEFSAAHRLHSPELSDVENASKFGKCNNANGHGHNYVLQVSVECAESENPLPISDFDRIVNENVIQLFDHKNLDYDCADFETLPSTVENIAQVIANRLDGRFGPNQLRQIRLYETPKTWADVVLS